MKKSSKIMIAMLLFVPIAAYAVETVELVVEAKNSTSTEGRRSVVVVADADVAPPPQTTGWNTYAEAPPYVGGEFYGDFFPRSERHGFKAKLMVMYRLVDQLELDEDTATKFFPIYMTYINERDNLMKEHRDLIRSISDGVANEDVDISTLQKKVSSMWKMEDEIDTQRTAFLKKAEKILDERQYIKLVVFNDKLKEDLISQFRSTRLREESRRRMEEAERQRRKMMNDADDIDIMIKKNSKGTKD